MKMSEQRATDYNNSSTKRNRKQMNETSINENENNLSSYQQPRYQQNIEISGRKLPSIPSKHTDDNDDLLPMENGQFSSNINYVQRKSSHITQSNSLEINQNRHHYPESYVNGLSIKPKSTHPIDSPTNRRVTSNPMPSTFQPFLKRQQSLGYDKNVNVQRLSDRGSIKTTNTNQSKRSTNGNSRISNIEQQRRF